MPEQTSWNWTTTGFTFATEGLEAAAEKCLQAGFSGVEGTPPNFQGMSDETISRTGKVLADAGVPVRTLHIPFTATDDIASFYETDRRSAVENVSRWMERAALLGAHICIQHPTTQRRSVDIEDVEPFFRQLGRSLETLLPLAENLGLTIALENMLHAEWGQFASRPEHLARVGELFPHERLGFCLDTGHALVAGGPEGAAEFFDVMKSRMVAFHLADNAGDRDSHLAPGRGRVDWTALFKGIAEMRYTGAICIETPPFGAGPPYSDEDWAALLAETKKLADDALRA